MTDVRTELVEEVAGGPTAERAGAAPPTRRADPPASLVGEGLIAAWERQCRLVPGASLYRHDGLVVAVADPGGPTPGTVLVEQAPADAARALEVAEALCAAHGCPLTVEAAAGAHPDVEAALVEAGYRPGLRRPAMVAEPTLEACADPSAATAHTRPAVASPPPPTRLRAATPADLPALWDLDAACFGLAPARAARLLTTTVLADPGLWTVVADDDGTVTAKAHGRRHRQGLGVLGVATAPTARGRGLATALVGQLLAAAAAADLGLVWLVADVTATDLYRRLGFAPVAEWITWAHPGPLAAPDLPRSVLAPPPTAAWRGSRGGPACAPRDPGTELGGLFGAGDAGGIG